MNSTLHEGVTNLIKPRSVLQILHVEPHVFVTLHNGAMVVYARDKQGLWDMENYQIIVVDTTGWYSYSFFLRLFSSLIDFGI